LPEENLRSYELLAIFNPEITSDRMDDKTQEISTLIESEGGQISTKDNLGVKSLSYPIKNQSEGNYVLFNLNTNPSSISALNKTLNGEEEILRFSIIKTI